MNAIQYIMISVSGLHQALINDVKILSPEQLKWKPVPGANPVGFLFWHAVRIEDNFINKWQNKTSNWEAEQWYQKMAMDAAALGTGFHDSEVAKIAALPLSLMLDYADSVYHNTMTYLQTLEPEQLDLAPNPQRPTWTFANMISNFIIAHGWWHLGEIRYIKGMQGMPALR